ncbi:arylesterase [Methylomarinum vadi]|uniref:arylesterase n=1 Tax=Methylomarinum vadi TaxID=438855 RepID=UPI001F3A62AC|nr:arylesterase [Methylomarinum vadi]
MLCLFSATLAAKSIVVLGDSISAGYGMEVQQGWVALLQQRLDRHDSSYNVFNESISGDTTAGGLARIDRALTQYKPSVLILELGANDGLRGLSPKIMKANLAQIIKRAQDVGSHVLLLSMRIPPNYGKRYTEMFYNVYPQLAEEMKVTYVPFILQDVALVRELMQRDGLHPNHKAQAMIADKVWQYLQPLL